MGENITLVILLNAAFTFHAGRLGAGRTGDLARETRTLDGLRALLDPVLVTAAMDGHHLTCTLLHLVLTCARER